MNEATRIRVENAAAFAARLCMAAGKDQAYYDVFWDKLLHNPDVLKELIYYMEEQKFLCAVNIQGVTLVDLMVWQKDHFKLALDRDEEIRWNRDLLLLTAFELLMQCKEDPEPILSKMARESGQDF